MNFGLLLTLIVCAGTLLVFVNRLRDDLGGNKPYLYVLGAILAGAIGLLFTGLYDRELILWGLSAAFLIWVVIPGTVLSWRLVSLLHGSFETALLSQKLITILIWSRVERKMFRLLRAADRAENGEWEAAERAVEEVKKDAPPSTNLWRTINQLEVLLQGNRREWSSVIHTYEQMDDGALARTWIPVLIVVARAYVEQEQFDRADRVLARVDQFSLGDREELATRTVRMARHMCAGNYDQGDLLLSGLREDRGDQLPAPFVDYWKARGLQAVNQFDEARMRYRLARDRAGEAAETDWRTKIDERLTDLEIEETRKTGPFSYSMDREELTQPVLEQTSSTGSERTVREAEPVIGEEEPSEVPPPEVVDFIQKVNRIPRATVVLLGIIGFAFLFMYFGVRISYPEGQLAGRSVSNPTTDPVALVVFGMKADYMIDESAGENSPPLREQLDRLEIDPLEIDHFETALRRLGDGKNREVSKQQLQDIWMNARMAHLFGFTETGRIDYPKRQYWRLATCTLLHIGWFHVLLNGYALWILGKLMENIYGWRDFLLIYLFSGLAGSIGSWKFGASQASAGASGAIFGLLGAAIALTIIKKEGMPETIRNRLAGPLVFWTVVNLALGFAVAQIDNAGHIGGLIGGLLMGYLISPTSGSDGANRGGELLKWGAFAVLAGLYGWAIVKGISFVAEYLPRIV